MRIVGPLVAELKLSGGIRRTKEKWLAVICRPRMCSYMIWKGIGCVHCSVPPAAQVQKREEQTRAAAKEATSIYNLLMYCLRPVENMSILVVRKLLPAMAVG